MKNLTKVLLVVFSLLLAASFAYAIHEEKPSETQAVMPGPDAAKLYEYIAKSKPYDQWKLWPGKGRLYKGGEPHGALLTTFVNNEAYFSIGKKAKMDENAIIVKENYTGDKKLVALTVMYKIKGYSPSAGDWFWAKYDPFGKVLASGRVDACINCHGAKKDNDYIMTAKLK